MNLDPETIQKLREKGKESLFFFARAILGFSDLDKEIHMPICRALEDYTRNTRITVELPRTWFKSTVVSVAYSIWRAINDPDIRILIAQNTYGNACKKLASIQSIFEKNQLFRVLYSEILPTRRCRWSAECLEVNRTKAHPEGTFEAAGVGTAAVSRHYDLIIEDDTIAPKIDDMTGVMQQPTVLDIEKAIGWHNLCFPMLLHPTKSQVVVVGTRWAERDLLGYIYERFPEYAKIQRTCVEDSLGNAVNVELGEDGERIIVPSNGHLTWPSRFDERALGELYKSEGPYMFACLYLGQPTAAINQVFKREWIKYFEVRKRSNCYMCTSLDLASADKEESANPDYTVVLTTAIDPQTGTVYVMEYTRDRMNPSDTIECLFQHYIRHRPIKVYVEAIGYQRTLVHWIKQKQRKTNTLFYIDEIKGHKQSKVERIRALQPYFSNGLILIKRHMAGLEQELLAFPKGEHDDIIDALCMQVPFWVEMMQVKEVEEKLAPNDPFSGASVINELRNRFSNVNAYPYDMGNLDDRYYDTIIRDPNVRARIIANAERERMERLVS